MTSQTSPIFLLNNINQTPPSGAQRDNILNNINQAPPSGAQKDNSGSSLQHFPNHLGQRDECERLSDQCSILMSTGLLSSLWAGLTTGRTGDATIATETDDVQDGAGDETPKAAAEQTSIPVPTFSLTADDTEDDQTVSSSTVPPTALMAPPPVPALQRRQPTSLGPAPNRGPPINSQQRAGTSGSRGKVLLAPGHSPMDWAALAKSSNLSGVPRFLRVTPSQMKVMNGRKGNPVWCSWQGKVYNITPYLPFHPGGEKELMKAAGRDATKLFMEIHPWVNWDGMLSACLVGALVPEEQQESALEAID